ncbi:hypothetical protein L596_000074 [Steinernema carpocapsae]|uniref:Uncharacterized protein n=1 Tax=Steinernema carpocapsae TaxID=34508 RepID=A0A4U8UGQ8_STECR|nr:hypothetical protein L596_000074 [Steinernema carpocapsae]
MTLQRRCTDRSRNITSETCNLVDEFRELRSLMSMRETEFAICVGHESVREVGLNPDIKASECNVTVNEPSVIHGCWRSVAVVKRRCQRLKKCCPAADRYDQLVSLAKLTRKFRCIKRLATSDTTNLVRRKHVDINLKTLKCRSEMEKVIKMNGNDKSNPIVNRAHAVITARSESLMDVVGQEHFMEDADEDPKSMDPFFPLKQKLRTKAKNVTTILKSRYTELARIAEELSAILLRKRQIRKQRELLKKYSSGFTSGKKRKLLLHSVKEAKGEAQKIRTLLKSVKNGSEILEVFKAASTIHPTMTTAKKKEFGKQIKFATVTSSNEVVETTLTATTPTTSTMSTELSTTLLPPPKIIRTADLTNVANKFGRPRKTFLPPPPDQDILLDRDTRTTVVPRAKSHHGKKRRHPLRVTQTRGLTSLPSMFGSSGASVPNLFAQKMKESRSVESPQKTPAEMQEYVRKGKGEVNRTTRAPEAYVGADGTWTMDPPNEEDSKKPFLEGQNEVIVTHEEGTFPMSPDHKELYGDGFENEIRRSGKHIWTMATGEPLLITSVERSAKDHYGNHATMSHIVEKELLQTRKNGAQRIPFNLLDDSQQDRVGIFPITTKEPRRIKITMWPPGYRNHFTRRPIVLQATTPTSARVSVVGQPFTSRMPESFYKVFYPQLKPAKRHRLKGYRNKVLFARRHLKRQKGRVASNYANAVTHHQPDEHIPTAVTKLPIHRLRPKQLDNRVNQIIDDPGQGSPRIASASAISNLSKSPLVTPASSR